jgi:hypothetical protein
MPNLTRVIPKGEIPLGEAELQLEFFVWLAGSWDFAGRVELEKSDIATGRADVVVQSGDIKLVTDHSNGVPPLQDLAWAVERAGHTHHAAATVQPGRHPRLGRADD